MLLSGMININEVSFLVQVLKLVNKLDRSSFCGMRREEDTVTSVFLDMVPKTAYNNVCLSSSEPITTDEETGLPSASLLKALLQALKDAGFNISEVRLLFMLYYVYIANQPA